MLCAMSYAKLTLALVYWHWAKLHGTDRQRERADEALHAAITPVLFKLREDV